MNVITATATAASPEARNQLLVSQASSRGIVLRRLTKSVYKKTGTGSAAISTWTGEQLTGFSVDVNPATNREAALQATIKDLRSSLSGPSRQQVEGWMAELDVITAKRAEDNMTINLRIKAYGKRLAAYPADIVHEALIVRRWHFWPTWDALAEVMEPDAFARRKMLDALEGALDPKQSAPPPPVNRVSAERAQQIRDAWKPAKTFGGDKRI